MLCCDSVDNSGKLRLNKDSAQLKMFRSQATFNSTPQRIRDMLGRKEEILEEFKEAREIDINLSLMHHLIIDLLGRNSYAAMIFTAKVEEE